VIAGSVFFGLGYCTRSGDGWAGKDRRAPRTAPFAARSRGLPSRIGGRGKLRPYGFAGIARDGWVGLEVAKVGEAEW
jgi:hypothetical protein